MALHYNLAKVYAQSVENSDQVLVLVNQFIEESSKNLTLIKEGIKEKDHKKTHTHARKLKPYLDLLGLKVAFEEILQVEAWSKIQGRPKDIKETYRSIKHQIKSAVKELKKDFNLQINSKV